MTVRKARSLAPVALVGAVFVVTVELIRAAGPLLDQLAGRWGVVQAALLAVAVYGGPALIGPLAALVGPARATTGLVVALVGLRLVAQAQPAPALLVVGGGAAVGLGALVMVVRQVVTARSGVTATVGLLVGAAVDQAVRAVNGTWDAVFRPGALPWVLAVAYAGVVLAAAWEARRAFGGGTARCRAGAIGPFLGLYVLTYGSA